MLINGEKLVINDNDKDIESSFKKNFNVIDNNVNDGQGHKSKLCSDAEAEEGAERYVRLLNAPECREFFLKVMYHLPYDTRERILETAVKPRIKSPARYFTYCAKRELALLGF